MNRPFPRCLFSSVSKRVLVHNLSYGNELSLLHVHCLANQTHFHNKGCAPGLVLKQRQKTTRKWPIGAWWRRKALAVVKVVAVSGGLSSE